jgi:hypothetical protein
MRMLSMFKGTVSRDFLLLVFFMNQFPQALENTIRAVSNFFENSRRYSQLKVETGGKFATGINDTSGKFGHQFQYCC